MGKYILNGDDIDGMLRALREAKRFEARDGRPSGNLLGLRIDGKTYSVKWNKSGISVWENPVVTLPRLYTAMRRG